MTDTVPAGRAKLTPPRSYANKIADILRAEIEQGIFRPGERLPTESEIGQNFGVSRAVVREAVSALKQDGLIESFQGRGIFVANSPPEAAFRLSPANLDDRSELQQVLEFLLAHEGAATELAAERRSEVQLADIRAALEAMEAAVARHESGTDEDLRFHAAIVAATGNPIFIAFSRFLENRVRSLIRNARENSKRAGLSALAQAEHRAIYDAVAARDTIAARQAAETHLRNAAARLRDHWRLGPE